MNTNDDSHSPVSLGNFSVSLSVQDLQTALTFYRALGFETIGGKAEENWLILKNGDAKVGIFQGMFEGNLMTFNPPDARGVQAILKKAGYELIQEASEGTGPTSCMLKDPDGNLILIDQHE